MSETATPANRLMQGVIPYIAVAGADDAIAFYRRAFGAELKGDIHRDQTGRVLNATLEINGGALMVLDHMAELGEPPARGSHALTLQIVSHDGAAFWQRAVEAGCTVEMPFEQQFWGDRYGRINDPFGLVWAVNEPSTEAGAAAAE
ncbi:MAG: hypothetical protein AcusKO_14140 [Acuticoccus sp.]